MMPTPASMWRSWIVALRERPHARERRAVVDAEHQRLVLHHMRRDLRTVRAQQVEHLRQVQLSLGVVRAQTRQRRAQRLRREHEDARVDLANLLLGRRRVALLPLSRPRARPHRRRRVPPSRSRVGSSRIVVAIVAAAPLSRWASTSAAIASALSSGTSPAEHQHRRRRTRRDFRPAPSCAIAAITAPPVPFGRCCTASSTPSGSTASSARAGESTTTTLPAPAASAARTGHSTIGMPHSSCSTFGVRERMRVPWPAARIRTVGALTRCRCYSDDERRRPQLGGRDSNPDSEDQNLMCCHYPTPQWARHRRM